HMCDVFDRTAVGIDQAVVYRHQLEVVGGRLGDDARAELYVRRADDEALYALCAQIVDSGLNLLTVLRADLDEGETLLLGGDVGELPFVLEPRLFRLLHDEADLHVCGEGGGRGEYGDGASQYSCFDKAHCLSPK